MKKTESTWRFILKVVGAFFAIAGLACLLVAYWDKLAAFFGAIGEKCKCRRAEFNDYEDELLYD